MNAPVRPLVLTDLDDTLFMNSMKVPEGARQSCTEVVRDTGYRLSVMTPRQMNFFNWIAATCDIVPVTARSLSAFRKIDLSFGDGWKIAGNGAVVIDPAGEVDEEWAAIMRNDLPDFASRLQVAHDAAMHWIRLVEMEVEVKRYSEHGLEHCVLFASRDPACLKLEELGAKLRYEGLHTHHNGSTLAFTAGPVSKKRAVEYVLTKIGDIAERPILAFGDSLSDLPFMSLGDFICAPGGSQVAKKAFAGAA